MKTEPSTLYPYNSSQILTKMGFNGRVFVCRNWVSTESGQLVKRSSTSFWGAIEKLVWKLFYTDIQTIVREVVKVKSLLIVGGGERGTESGGRRVKRERAVSGSQSAHSPDLNCTQFFATNLKSSFQCSFILTRFIMYMCRFLKLWIWNGCSR